MRDSEIWWPSAQIRLDWVKIYISDGNVYMHELSVIKTVCVNVACIDCIRSTGGESIREKPGNKNK